jgi:hypothetical protein
MNSIKLTAEQIQFLHNNSGYDGGFREGGQVLKGFEKWWIHADEDTGEYDAGKSSMVNYEIKLYKPLLDEDGNVSEDDEGVLVGTAIGGYYNGNIGHRFNYSLEFFPPEPDTPESRFRNFLMDIAKDNLSMDKMINKIEKEIKNLKDAK